MDWLINAVLRIGGAVLGSIYVHAAVTDGTPHVWMLIVGLTLILVSF